MRRAALLAALLTAALTGTAHADDYSDRWCATVSGASCTDGGGRQTPGGGGSVSHKGWPAIHGIFVMGRGGAATAQGGDLADELLGHHGSDRLRGGSGPDVLWGDYDPSGQPTSQRDVLSGEAGNDWLYSSHGHNAIRGGTGADLVWAYYGRGTIDCGPGFDTVRVRLSHRYAIKNCERTKNFCAFGSKPGNAGGCYKPGERPARRD